MHFRTALTTGLGATRGAPTGAREASSVLFVEATTSQELLTGLFLTCLTFKVIILLIAGGYV